MFASIIYKDANHLANCIQKKTPGRQSSAKWQDRQQQDGDVQGSEVQIHGDPKKPTNDDGEGHHEESDLRAASKGHSQGEIHLIFGGHRHSCEMLRRIAHLGAPQYDLRKTWELGCDNLWLIGAQMRGGQGNQDLFRSISNLRTCFF